MPAKEEYDLVTIRLRKGDRDALKTYFHPLSYNAVIRNLTAKLVDKIQSDGQAKVQINETDINLEDQI